ncbi:MAG: PfkB family carbohydrate kinase [Candidatus Omnitrophica bacterium]|nr:PfkB family carbohydrate kinase [Candidatus Omnitrophota bacterium]MDD5487338.1 PfkB family carbohydrate kinase [Candidatus Omnitrophota bacterium]
MKRTTVIGSMAMDSVETPFGKVKDVLGGSATYASISASVFAPVNIISVVGTDFPERYMTLFKKRGVDTGGLRVAEGKTFRWSARYDFDLAYAETLRTELNVFQDFKPVIPDNVSHRDNLLLANIDPELQRYIFNKVKPTGLVACDTMNLWIQHKRSALLKLLKKVDIFLLNDAEARQLSGEKGLLDAARYISSCGVKMVVIKKGEHGALFFSKGLRAMVPAYLLEKIADPTGAGDTFAGGMIGYLSGHKRINDRVLRKSLVYGSILASFTVEGFSVEGLLKATPRNIDNRYRHFEKLTRF